MKSKQNRTLGPKNKSSGRKALSVEGMDCFESIDTTGLYLVLDIVILQKFKTLDFEKCNGTTIL